MLQSHKIFWANLQPWPDGHWAARGCKSPNAPPPAPAQARKASLRPSPLPCPAPTYEQAELQLPPRLHLERLPAAALH